MKLFNRLFLSLFTVAMVACSFGSHNNTSNRANQEDDTRFVQDYSVIFGNYDGTVSANPVQNVTVAIYAVPEVIPGAVDDRGQPRTRQVAKARYTRLNSSQADRILDVVYNAETFDIRMTVEMPKAGKDQPGPAPVGSFMITGKASGSTISGVAVSGGKLGDVSLRKVGGAAEAPPEGDVEDRNRRLRALYQPLVGEYFGQVTYPNQETLKFGMRLYVEEALQQDGTVMPILLSYYKRADDPAGEIALTFDCTYSTDTNPPTLNMISRPFPFGGQTNDYKISLVSRVITDPKGATKITGSMTETHKARTGTMTITKRTSSSTDIPIPPQNGKVPGQPPTKGKSRR